MSTSLLALMLVAACAPVQETDTAASDSPPLDSAEDDTPPADTVDSDSPAPTDADGDGFTVAGGDCDDGDPAAFPGATEHCDDVDEDCDGVVDGGLRVPTDHATIDAALAASAEGDTICVAAGSYAGGVVTGGRSVTVEGAGSEVTVLDAAGAGTVLTVDGGALTLRGLTITGGSAASGAGLAASDAELTLEDVVVRDNTCEADTCQGTGIFAERTRVVAMGLSVSGNLQVGHACTGAGIYLSDTTGTILTDVDVRENRQEGVGLIGAGAAFVGEWDATLLRGSFDENVQAAQGDGGSFGEGSGAGLYVVGGALSGETVSVSRNLITLDTSSEGVDGGGLAVFGSDVTFGDLSADDNVVEGAGNVFLNGAGVEVWEGTLRVDGGSCSRNRVVAQGYANVSGAGLGVHYGALELEDVEVDENSVSTEVYTPEYLLIGAGLDLVETSAVATRLTIRGNNGDVDQPLVGAGISVNGGTADFTNLILAGNGADADTEDGVALTVASATLTVTNADIVGNGREGWCCTGPVLTLWGAVVTFTNVAVVDNIGVESGAFSVEDATVTLRYGDLYGNSEPAFSGLDDPTGVDGNLAVDPMYTDMLGSAVAWDLHLASGSPLLDAGDPAILDSDGTRSDVGAFGGPNGDW